MGGLPRLAPPPTPEAAAKHQEDNAKRVKMLRDAYDVKHQRLVKQTQHLAEVKRKVCCCCCCCCGGCGGGGGGGCFGFFEGGFGGESTINFIGGLTP